MQAGPAILCLDPESGTIGIIDSLGVLLRHQAGHQLFRRIDQQARGLAILPLEDFAA